MQTLPCHSALRLLATLLIAVPACGGPTGPSDAPPTRAQLFDEVWRDVDAHYAFFQLGGIDWDDARAAYRDSVIGAPDDDAAARLLGAMLLRLHDHHVALVTGSAVLGEPPLPTPTDFIPAVVRDYYVTGSIRPTRSGRIYYATLAAGAGYIRLDSFQGSGWSGDMDEALAALGPVAGLVIDVRGNLGGDEANAQGVAARLYDRARVYRISRFRDGAAHGDFAAPSSTSLSPGGTGHFTGRIALITNRLTASAAEDFTLMLRALPYATTVGDSTLGTASNPRDFRLANGWTLRVPQSIQSTPDGYVYQWTGLPPAIPVRWGGNDATRDAYLDAAIAAMQPG